MRMLLMIGLAVLCGHLPSVRALEFDQNVTPDVIFGSGNANGSFTTDRAAGVELGLRGKLRHNAAGAAENTFNSNGDGTYSFQPGVAPTQAFPTAEWSFEWSVNTDYDGSSELKLADLTYELGVDKDPSLGTDYVAFDPFVPTDEKPFWDHSMGDNATANGAGVEAVDVDDYFDLLETSNVAQNSWKPHWVLLPDPLTAYPGFDPTVEGNYSIYLTAYDADGNVVASTAIEIIVGDDSDGDGLPDGADACPDSDLRDTVFVGDCDSGVANFVFNDGCSLADEIAHIVDECAVNSKNHGQFVKCVGIELKGLADAGVITPAEKGALQSCVAKQK